MFQGRQVPEQYPTAQHSILRQTGWMSFLRKRQNLGVIHIRDTSKILPLPDLLHIQVRISRKTVRNRAKRRSLIRIIDRGIIEQFVEKIVPRNTLEFDWYLNLIPHIFEDNSSTGYNEVWTFVINFDEAEKYRKLRGGFLRKNQWRDLTVHVFV